MLLKFLGAESKSVRLRNIEPGRTVVYDGMLFIVTDEPQGDVYDRMCVRLSTGVSTLLSVDDEVIPVEVEADILSAERDLFAREDI